MHLALNSTRRWFPSSGDPIGQRQGFGILSLLDSFPRVVSASKAACCLLTLLLTVSLSNCVGPAGGSASSSAGGGGGGTITVPPPQLSVTVTPNTASLFIGTTQKFAAIVSNATNASVTWSVNGILGGNSTVGTIGGSGQYTAPGAVPVPSTVTITATSQQDPTKSDSALVVITQSPAAIQVSLTPSATTVQTGGVVSFNAQVTGSTNTSVAWSVNSIPGGNTSVGTISATGMYTAPALPPNPANVTVTATSVADPTASGIAIVTVQQRVQVSVSPTVANATVGTSLAFMSTVLGSTNTVVNWSVAGIPNGNSTVGTISAAGVYTAPVTVPSPATVTVVATSQAAPTAFAAALVTILSPTQIAVAVGPATATVATNAIQQFNATVTGTLNTLVTWQVNGIVGGNGTIGTISLSGLYTAPSAVPLPNTVTVTAVSQVNPTAFGSATVLVTGSSLVTVSVSPSTLNLGTGGSVQFFATVNGTTNTAVTWRVNGISGGNSVDGTITAGGVYTAPNTIPTPATLTVTATSVADPTASGFASVTIILPPVPIAVQVTPSTASLHVNNQLQFSAAVTGTTNPGVDWSVNLVKGGSASTGLITTAGVYTAPASVPGSGTVTVTATSQQDPTKSSSSAVTILAQATITMTPTTVTVQTGLGVQFFAVVTGLSNTGVTYKVNNVLGGNSTVGTINSTGLFIAPVTVPNPATVTVTATSVVDPTVTASSTVTIAVPVTVTTAPTSATIGVGQMKAFTATVTGTANLAVTWSVNGITGGNATVGTIDVNGNYLAPASLVMSQSFTITATSVASAAAKGSSTVTVTVPISVAVSPQVATVVTLGTITLTATVSGTSNTAVNWTTTSGSVSPAGLFTAPGAVPAGGTATVTATSQADLTKSAAATITIQLPVSVCCVLPANVNVNVNASQPFAATVTNTSNLAVTWSVNGVVSGNNRVGMIAANGVYTAPASVPTPATVTVTATSVADPTKSAFTMLTIQPVITVTVAPFNVNLLTNGMQSFSATVTGTANTAVNWMASAGSITAGGVFTAPAAPNPAVTITATSQANGTSFGTATANISAPVVSINVTPNTGMVFTGGQLQFSAVITGTANLGVNWAVVGGASSGTITNTGLYTAPAVVPNPTTISVTGTSQADLTKSDTSLVTIVTTPAVTVSPTGTSVVVSQQRQFTATVTGTANTSVTWSASAGTISSTGLFTAPVAVPSPATVTITATTVSPTGFSGSATTTIVPAVVVSISPTTASVVVSATQTFTPTVTGTANTAVTWTVNGVTNGNSTVGTINPATGVYTAPAGVPTPATVTVTATSVADPTKSASSTVTVLPPVSVTLTPATANVNAGATVPFVVSVTGSANMAVTWTVNGVTNGNSTVGTVNPATGVYTAPATVPNPSTVTVATTSVADPTKSDSTPVTILAVVGVTVSPSSVTLLPGQTQSFTPMVTGTSNTAVTWSVNGIVGGSTTVGTISTSGLYTAPATVPTPAIVSVTATSVADVTKSATSAVTVSAPASGIFVTVFPRNRILPIGRTQKFTSHVFLTTNLAVNWQVNGIAGGNSTFGTIDTTGLYTPPTMRPANPNITVTAVSQADPTKSDTQNEQIVAGVTVSPLSDSLHVSDTAQFTATVSGVSNTAVTWAVNGVAGGNSTVGTITSGGLYTAPAAKPNPNMFSVTATSVADPTLPGISSMTIYPPRQLSVFPKTASVLPGNKLIFQYFTNIFFPTTSSSFGQVVSWSVNGIAGGNSTVGTINQAGLYTAPLTPQTVTLSVKSLISTSFFANATVTVTPATAASSVSLMDTLTKIRPYDIVSGSSSISLAAAQQEYADWQVLVTGSGEDLSNVDVTLSNFTDGKGNTIPASNGTIYFERFLNVFYSSRLQGSDLGEWPDPLVPKVDPFVHQVRNAFPFAVNRISRAYKKYPLSGPNAGNTGLGAGTAQSTGVYTGSVFKRFDVVIDKAGTVGTATFKWSTDGGATFQQTGVSASGSPVLLSDGVSVFFLTGNISGVTDFNVGDTFWIFAGPLRNQGVWIDLYVPMGTPAGNYTGTVTVTQTGKPSAVLAVNLQVYGFAIPVSSSIPNWFGAYWQAYVQAHFLVNYNSQVDSLGKLYGVACLMNRITCDVTDAIPQYTFNANGTVATASYSSSYDPNAGPLMDGTITPHGEQNTSLRLTPVGGNDTQTYFATQNLLAHLVSKGWRSRAFDYSRDEPGSPSDFLALMARTSLVRSVDMNFRALVTQSIDQNNLNSLGYVNLMVPTFTFIGTKDYQRGPQLDARPAYDLLLQPGDEFWWYDACGTIGCGNGTLIPYLDNYPNQMADTPALNNRAWGIMTLVPYRASGYLYYSVNIAFSFSYAMGPPRVDVWDSIYNFGGNGDGTYFYPGRPSNIGGTTDIPVESLRIKQVRDAFVDMEYGLRLQAQGDDAFLESNVLATVSNIFTFDPNPATWTSLRKTMGQKIK